MAAMSNAQRLFIGIDLPDSLKAALSEINPRVPGLRWLHPANIHLTLSFLGNVNAARKAELISQLEQVHIPPFFLPLQGIGTFGRSSRPSVIWVGVGKGHPHLFALHRKIQDAVIKAGIEPDLKPFHPHVTLSRCDDVSGQALQPFLRKHRDADFGLIEVKEFILYSSVLRSGGSVYTAEARVPLRST
jgi:RNA 2',3'-cyclic 3'-phosphodiesterase